MKLRVSHLQSGQLTAIKSFRFFYFSDAPKIIHRNSLEFSDSVIFNCIIFNPIDIIHQSILHKSSYHFRPLKNVSRNPYCSTMASQNNTASTTTNTNNNENNVNPTLARSRTLNHDRNVTGVHPNAAVVGGAGSKPSATWTPTGDQLKLFKQCAASEPTGRCCVFHDLYMSLLHILIPLLLNRYRKYSKEFCPPRC